MKIFTVFIALLFAFDGLSQNANAILHIWETREKDAKIIIYKSGEKYNAREIHGKKLLEADGKTYKKDVNNPDPALRTRILKDYIMISGLVYKDGKIYNYQDGNSYDVTISIQGNVMNIRVYKGMPIHRKDFEMG